MLEMWSRHARLHRDLLGLRETLGKQVQTDDLTQLLNRRYFFQAAHREVSRARRYNQPLSCLMVDINYFKLFNKTFGYGCGDYILRAVATTVRAWTRESDILARFGAKKFVILLPSTDIEGAMMLREKLQSEIGQFDFMWQDQKLPVTISIGEAERRREDPRTAERQYRTPAYEEDERSDIDETPLSVREELADLLEDADAALYVAKKGVRYPVIQPPTSNTDEVVGILGSS
jgi:diguanylate cyclase (GGDEF)-like protein